MNGASRLQVSPRLIVARNPSLDLLQQTEELVAWLPDSQGPIPVSADEVLLLAEILAGAQPVEPTRALAAKLLEKRLLVEEEVPAADHPLADIEAELCSPRSPAPAASLAPTRHLKLRWNFAMRPGRGGFVVWSVASRRYLRIPPEGIQVLCRFTREATAHEVAADALPEVQAWIDELQRHGIIAEAEALNSETIVQTRIYDLESSLKREMETAQQDLAALRLDSATSSVSGGKRKIPVYSVHITSDGEVRAYLPLALGMIRAFAKSYKNGALLEHFELIADDCFTPGAVRRVIARHGPGVVLFSDYIWSVEGNLLISKALKEISRDFITLHGGPSVPAYEAECERFFQTHEHVDITVRGEGEVTAAETLEALGAFTAHWPPPLECLREVAGISYRSSAAASGSVRNADRPRAQDINQFPSPYLTGTFDHCATDTIFAGLLETNRGCPYGCTFCDWGSAINQKVKLFDLERVRAEIEWLAARKVPILWCADANFGIFDRDVEIAKMIVDAKRRHGFPRQFFVNYAKNATANLAEIIRIFQDAGIAADGIISIQTTDPKTLTIIKRANIKTKRYDELLNIFRGLKLPISTDLMLGLPGSTLDSLANDLQYYFDREVPAKAYRTRVLPNSPMADPAYMEKYQIRVDEQSMIVSTFSFTAAEYARIQSLYLTYSLFESSGILHYVLRYLQWDLGIQAIDLLRDLEELVRSRPEAYTAITWVSHVGASYFNVSGWRPFYDEVMRYLARERGVKIDSALEAAFRAQEAVMRDAGRTFPETVELAHDVASYIADRRAAIARGEHGAGRLLSSYPPAKLVVTDPTGLCALDPRRTIQYDHHVMRWELSSPLATIEPVAFFMDMTQTTSAPDSARASSEASAPA